MISGIFCLLQSKKKIRYAPMADTRAKGIPISGLKKTQAIEMTRQHTVVPTMRAKIIAARATKPPRSHPTRGIQLRS